MVVRAADSVRPGALNDSSGKQTSLVDLVGTVHELAAVKAEANDLLDTVPLVLDPWAPMSRGEVAQVLENLLRRMD